MAQEQKFGSKELIEAAEKEGELVYYTANFAEVEQEVIKAFNKRFPRSRWRWCARRAASSSPASRPRRRPASCAADVIDHSDRGLMLEIERPVPGLRAAERGRLPARRAGVAQAVARRHARLGDRLQHPAGEEPAQVLDGPHQARIRQQADRPGGRALGRHHLDPHHVRAPGAGRGLLGQAGGARHRPVSLGRAALRRAGARRGLDRAAALQHHLHQDRRRRAGRGDLRARGRADHSLRRRRHQDRQEPQRRQAVHELALSARKARPSRSPSSATSPRSRTRRPSPRAGIPR